MFFKYSFALNRTTVPHKTIYKIQKTHFDIVLVSDTERGRERNCIPVPVFKPFATNEKYSIHVISPPYSKIMLKAGRNIDKVIDAFSVKR